MNFLARDLGRRGRGGGHSISGLGLWPWPSSHHRSCPGHFMRACAVCLGRPCSCRETRPLTETPPRLLSRRLASLFPPVRLHGGSSLPQPGTDFQPAEMISRKLPSPPPTDHESPGQRPTLISSRVLGTLCQAWTEEAAQRLCGMNEGGRAKRGVVGALLQPSRSSGVRPPGPTQPRTPTATCPFGGIGLALRGTAAPGGSETDRLGRWR